DNRTAERPCAVLGPRVHAYGPFEFRRVLRLVDVPVEPKDRLRFEDRGTEGRAPDRDQDLLTPAPHWTWRVRCCVGARGNGQPGLVRRSVHQGNAAGGDLGAASARL